jgi:hypothetical protein
MNLSVILLEGKKEILIDKYKNIFKVNGFEQLLSDFIDTDPSTTKKYAEWMINQFKYLMDKQSFSSMVDAMNLITDQIIIFNNISNSITKDDLTAYKETIEDYKRSGIKYFDDGQLQRLEISPKDIYSYPTIWTLQIMNKIVDDRKEIERLEISAKKESEKLYEDNRYLIIVPYSYGASCYYGAGTKWCTTKKNDDSHYRRYMSDGRLIYIIDKKSSSDLFGKMAIFQSKGGNIEVFDQKDDSRSLQFLLERFDDIKDKINEILNNRDDYYTLKNVKEGKTPKKFARLSSPYFKEFNENKVIFDFDDDLEKVLDLFDLSEEEKWEYSSIMSTYSYDNLFYDSYNSTEDLERGYILYDFNNEHLEVLKKILNILNPKLSECITEKDGSFNVENDCMSNIGTFLSELNNSFIDDIKEIYSSAKDESMKAGVIEEITKEYCDAFKDIGLEVVDKDSCFNDYEIEIDKLIEYYEENLDFFKNKSVDELLKSVVESKLSIPIYSPRELAYEVSDDEVFDDLFNKETLEKLESFLENIEEGEEFSDFNEYMKILTQVKKTYNFDNWIKLKNIPGNIQIKLESIDPEDNKIRFIVRDMDRNKSKGGYAKLSTINALINNASLFDPFFDDED